MPHTRVLRIDPLQPDEKVIGEAAEVIKAGGTVIFPTETVYGIGADALNSTAALKVFEAKQRPPDNPLIVHIARYEDLLKVAVDIPPEILSVIQVIWPGPITFVLRRNPKVPLETTGGLDTVAVRMPAHPVALKLIEASGTPIGAPSANLAGRPSPTRIDHVLEEMNDRVDLMIDAGPTFFGIESTVIDVTRKPPVLLRPGPFTVEEINKIIGNIVVPEEALGKREAEVPLSPGMKYRHYAPSTRLVMVNSSIFKEAVHYLQEKGIRVAVICTEQTCEGIDSTNKIVLGRRDNLYEVAKNLFDSLRRLDTLDVDLGIVESFPEHGIGLAIMNRLRKATGHTYMRDLKEVRRLTDN